MKFLKRLLGLGGKDDKQEKDSFSCKKCGEDFETEAELKIHKHKHKNEEKGKKKEKKKDKKSTSKGGKESGVDYDELVSNTIKDIKSKVKDMDDVDYKKLLKAEKNNKDRKTMKSWIEDRMD